MKASAVYASFRRSWRTRAYAAASILVLLSSAPAYWSPSVFAYEGDHYAWTYYLALQVGFTKRQAYQIASGTYALDWDPNTSPMSATKGDILLGANHALFGVFGKQHPELAYIWSGFHAFADEQLLRSCPLCPTCDWISQREIPPHQCGATIMRRVPPPTEIMCSEEVAANVEKAREQRKWELFGQANADGNPGVLLHFLQDYYAHFEWDDFRGHFLAAHLPDHLSNSPAKAECATRDTLSALQQFRDGLASFHGPRGGQVGDSGLTDNPLPQQARSPDMRRISEVLAQLIEINPVMGSWLPWETPTNLSVGGQNAAVPSLGRSVAVINKAITEDEKTGQLPRWPMKLDTFELMPPSYYPYHYDKAGRMSSSVMGVKVEQLQLSFEPPDIQVTQNGDSLKLHLKIRYKIRGYTEMWDHDILNKYLSPIPVIERDQVSNESSPTEHQFSCENDTYTIEREVEKKVEPGTVLNMGGVRFANGCGPSTPPEKMTPAERMLYESRNYAGGHTVPDWPCPSTNLQWTVSVQVYGYAPQERTFSIGGNSSPESNSPSAPANGGGESGGEENYLGHYR